MTREESNYSKGLNFTSVLFLIFLVLKLVHVIDWSWWWITAPLWMAAVLVVVVWVVALIIYGLRSRSSF